MTARCARSQTSATQGPTATPTGQFSKAPPSWQLHDLRHLAGTLTAQAGATLREIMDRLGHSSPQAAVRYQHVALERNERVARAIDDLLDSEDRNDQKEAPGS